MSRSQSPKDQKNADNLSAADVPAGREEKLARQLRENLAKRKRQSRARNTKPRTFKANSD